MIPSSLWNSNHYYVAVTDKTGTIQSENQVYKKAPQGSITNIFERLVESDKVMLAVSINKLKPDITKSLTLRSMVGKKLYLTSWDFCLSPEEENVIFIGHDVTATFNTKLELEKTNNKLVAQKELFKVLLEKNKAGFWYWDLENDKQKLSPEIKQMLHLNTDSHDLTWQSRISTKDLKSIKSNLKEHLISHGKIPFYQEIKNILEDGSSLWVICFGKVFKWKKGRPVSMIGCFIDINQTKNAEETILKQNESLKKISFNHSHLMRAKVANILGLLNILDGKILNEENKDFFKLIKKETAKLDKIIRENVHDSQTKTCDYKKAALQN